MLWHISLALAQISCFILLCVIDDMSEMSWCVLYWFRDMLKQAATRGQYLAFSEAWWFCCVVLVCRDMQSVVPAVDHVQYSVQAATRGQCLALSKTWWSCCVVWVRDMQSAVPAVDNVQYSVYKRPAETGSYPWAVLSLEQGLMILLCCVG